MVATKVIIIAILVVVALAGAAIGIYFGVKSGDDEKNSSNASSNPNKQKTSPPSKPSNQTTSEPLDPSTKDPSTEDPSTSTPITLDPSIDPSKETYGMHMFAVGDWGSTTDKPGSCCRKYRDKDISEDSQVYLKDLYNQEYVSHLMMLAARQFKPKLIIGHGDNFYWNGLGKNDANNRFDVTFEKMYNQPELKNIKWVNVMGNHDYGGSQYICGDADYQFRECTSTQELLKFLNAKFTLQSSYQSPNSKRWQISSPTGEQYYKYVMKDGDVTMDIYNVDTNYADSHGARQICCQCYGYRKKIDPKYEKCGEVIRGSPYCAGGDTGMFDACMKKLSEISENSLSGFKKDALSTKSDWKLVNSHYSPHFHMGGPKRESWQNALKKTHTQVFMNGHTHGANHDFGQWTADSSTHFFENGVGGGIQSASGGAGHSGVKNLWIGQGVPYGFFQISASKNYLKMEFVTFGGGWFFDKDPKKTKRGDYKVAYCYYIPIDGSKGKKC